MTLPFGFKRNHIMNCRRLLLSAVCCFVLSISLQAQTVKSLNLVTNHIIYEPVSGMIYASVPSSAGSNGNSIATIDPTRAAITRRVFIGSEPDVLAASDDGQFVYAGLDGADAVRRYTIATHSAGLQFSLGGYLAGDLKVLQERRTQSQSRVLGRVHLRPGGSPFMTTGCPGETSFPI